MRRRRPDHGLGRHLRHGLFAQRRHHARAQNLEALASIYCGLEANYKEKFLRDGLKVKLKKQADFWKVVSSEVLYLYCAADVWVTRRVRDALLDRLRLKPYWLDLYYGHYLPLQSAILEAERVGFYIDRGRANLVNARLSAECERLIAQLRDMADDPNFNVRSLPQLQTLLFDRWSLPQVEGRSTQEAVLETLLGDELLGTDQRRFLKTLLEYRGVDKLRGTYCQGILDKLSDDSRLRPNWNIAGTVTARFSCEAPAINTLPHEGTREPLTMSKGGMSAPQPLQARARVEAARGGLGLDVEVDVYTPGRTPRGWMPGWRVPVRALHVRVV